MPANLDDKLVVALSSRALFDFEAENAVFDEKDPLRYQKLQLERLDRPAGEGIAFKLVKKLLAFNSANEHKVEVVILSRNDPVSGLRVFKSAEHHKLPITRGVFLRGRSPFGYLNALKADLFLSAHPEDVRQALEAGFPAARVYATAPEAKESSPDEVRVAFDGDAVLFSDQAEQVFQQKGLSGFEDHERSRVGEPLPPGPLQPFLRALQILQKNPPKDQRMRIRTALVTSRSAPAHDRAIRTLMSWDVEVDEAMFLGGLEKGPFLQVFQPDFYFDDQMTHLESAAKASAGASGHVNAGVANAVLEPASAPAPVAAVPIRQAMAANAPAPAQESDATTVNRLIRSRRPEKA
jgi:5'-nucleotidase